MKISKQPLSNLVAASSNSRIVILFVALVFLPMIITPAFADNGDCSGFLCWFLNLFNFDSGKNDIQTEVPKIKELQQQVAQLQTENKNLRNDLTILEKENTELMNKLGTGKSSPPTTPTTDPLDAYAKNNPVIRGMKNGEVSFYFMDASEAYYFGPLELAINDVLKLLESQSTSKVKFTRVYDEKNAHITVAWIKDHGNHILGQAFQQYLNIGLGKTACDSEWHPFDQGTITRIMMHEIGHSLGFGHSSDVNNIMYPITEFRITYPEMLPDGYFAHQIGPKATIIIALEGEPTRKYTTVVDYEGEMLLCKGKYKIEIESDQPVDVYLGRDCHEIQTMHFQRTCTVEDFAILSVINTPDEVFYNVTVQRADPPLNKDMNWDKNAFRYPDIYSDIFN